LLLSHLAVSQAFVLSAATQTSLQAAEKLSFTQYIVGILDSGAVVVRNLRMLKKAVSKAAGESKPEAYPRGYVEDFDESRTKLAGFFSILLRLVVL
jgi:hypothetical protein